MALTAPDSFVPGLHVCALDTGDGHYLPPDGARSPKP